MDLYSGPTIKISGDIVYRVHDLTRRHFMGIWSEEAFSKNEPPDIDVVDLKDPERLEVLVPEHIGNIYLGILEVNLLEECTPQDIVSELDSFPLFVRNKDINGNKIYIRYAEISVKGQVEKEGTFLLTEEMTILDAIRQAGGYTGKTDRPSSIKILRLQEGTLNIPAVLIEKKGLLRAGDRIYVE